MASNQPGLILSCDGCVMVNSARCADCLVNALAGPVATLDSATLRAVSALQGADLLPPLRRVVAVR
jgi:hypothetical protein